MTLGASGPLVLKHDRTSAQANNAAQLAQEFAQHDSISGHANNALLILSLIDPGSFTDPDVRESLEGIRRRLLAIVELVR